MMISMKDKKQKMYYENYVYTTIQGHLDFVNDLGLQRIVKQLESYEFFQEAIVELGYSWKEDIYPYIRREAEKRMTRIID